MAHRIFDRLVSQCDLAIGLHTSTRNRTTIYHVRADLENPEVERLARAFGANVVLYGEADEGSLRTSATAVGTPTITVEMGRVRRFQPALIEMQRGPYPFVHEGETICPISDHFKTEAHVVTAPFTGLIVGSLENPVALPGNPLVHLVEIDDETREEIEREIRSGEFDGYRVPNATFSSGD